MSISNQYIWSSLLLNPIFVVIRYHRLLVNIISYYSTIISGIIGVIQGTVMTQRPFSLLSGNIGYSYVSSVITTTTIIGIIEVIQGTVMTRNCDDATAFLDLLRPPESMSGLRKILHYDSLLPPDQISRLTFQHKLEFFFYVTKKTTL